MGAAACADLAALGRCWNATAACARASRWHEATELLRCMRRVYGVTHPLTGRIEDYLRNVRRYLRAREEAAPDDVSSICEGLDAMRKPGDA